jgi:hypothetical protein
MSSDPPVYTWDRRLLPVEFTFPVALLREAELALQAQQARLDAIEDKHERVKGIMLSDDDPACILRKVRAI